MVGPYFLSLMCMLANFQVSNSVTISHIIEFLHIFKVVDWAAWISLSCQREAFSYAERNGNFQGAGI